ncbi:hypothetical protein GQ457_02G037440 [Hibiscus cannabinus]
MKKRFLLILDEVLLTTQSLDVCREMMTDKEIKLYLLKAAAAWIMFAQNGGEVIEVPVVSPLARAVPRECGGLPIALNSRPSGSQ